MGDLDLRNKRVTAGLSQLRLSLRSNVSRWRLRLCEEGFIKLRADELKRIASVFEQTRRGCAQQCGTPTSGGAIVRVRNLKPDRVSGTGRGGTGFVGKLAP